MEQPRLNIVAGIGDTAHDETVLRAAVELARRCGAQLHLVHSYDLPLLNMGPGFEFFDPAQITAYMDAEREAFTAGIAERFPGEPMIHCSVELAPAHEAIAHHARELNAELVIVGAHRRKGLAPGLLGTTTQRVLRASPSTVLVIRGDVHPPRRVLLTTDLSPLSAVVHERALDLIEKLMPSEQLELRSLMVIGFTLLPAPLPEQVVQKAAAGAMDEFLRARKPRAHPTEPRVRAGQPSEEIVAEAQEWGADLVVVGTHARHGVQRLLLGSVAEATLRDLPCNVLVVPPVPMPAQPRPQMAPVAQ